MCMAARALLYRCTCVAARRSSIFGAQRRERARGLGVTAIGASGGDVDEGGQTASRTAEFLDIYITQQLLETSIHRRFKTSTGRDLGESSKSPSFLEKIVDHCLPLYRAITRVEVVDGRATSFWLDKWTPGPTLATHFPAIFSHCTRLHTTVAAVVEDGIDLQPRLSTAAACELLEVQRLVADISLGAGADRRFIDTVRKASFRSREAYRMLSPPRPTDASSCVAWSLRLPSKLKIFAYLADIDRLSTRANLFHKSCAPSETCAGLRGD
ncbi:hypothetical protein QYE76_026401 [Lolium multiflorum]|uniref:Uncharacterized protein n=1 Tax=Lolium multiflorum TaxID=4521 RepID=A0AAD8VVJ8_LOLMU|nr:hypothetical protein QYE76_026401 [Lolium multiflorum]